MTEHEAYRSLLAERDLATVLAATISWPGREGNGDEADRILSAERQAAGGGSPTQLFRDSLRRLAADVALSAARAQRLGLHGLAGDLRLAGTELGQIRFASATEVA